MNLETFNVSNAEFVNEQTNYGRRRVGKTSLIRECIKEKQALYYLATEESIHINRKIFKDEEIDVVALDNSENTIVFGECKYWVDKVGISVLKNLQKKAAGVSWNVANRKEIFILFSINGFTEDLIGFAEGNENIVLHYGV